MNKTVIVASALLRIPGSPRSSNAQDFGNAKMIAPEDGDRLATLRGFGLSGDPTKISTLIAELNAPTHPYSKITAMKAIGQLGSDKALAALDSVIQNDRDPVNRLVAAVTRSRVIAEVAAKGIADPTLRASTKLNKFLQSLERTGSRISAAVPAQVQEVKTTPDRIPGIELLALREIADMIYRNRDSALLQAAVSQGIDFQLESASALKIRLAEMSAAQRISTLVDELAILKVMAGDAYHKVQLAVDEGAPAGAAVAAKLAVMDRQRDRYKYIGFAALFNIARALGDKTLEPVIARFLNDADGWISYYARQVYPNVRAGLRSQYRAGY